MADRYLLPRRLDDPELIGLWTIDEFLGLIIPFANVLIPLFLWISKADDNKIYDAHGRAVVNFHCTINLLIIISLLLFFPFPGL